MAKKNNVNVLVNTDFNECYTAKFMINENKKTVSCTLTEHLPFDLETIYDIDSILEGFNTSKLKIAVNVPDSEDIITAKTYCKDIEHTGIATCDPRDNFDKSTGCDIAFKQALRKRHNTAMQNIQDYINVLDNVKSKLLAYKNQRKSDFKLLMNAQLTIDANS